MARDGYYSAQIYQTDQDIMHYGRKGMKWYQKIFSKGDKSKGSSDQEDVKPKSTIEKVKAKRLSEYTDQEISQMATRLAQEKKIKEAITAHNAANKSAGRKFVEGMLKTTGQAAVNATQQVLAEQVTKVVKNTLQGQIEKSMKKAIS